MDWIAILAGVGVLLLTPLAAGWVFSGLLLHPNRQPVVRTPRDYGMDFLPVEFTSTDGVPLKGWFIPAAEAGGPTVIMTHPFPFNRHGFLWKHQGFPPIAFTDVDLLATARALHGAGHAVLMFDFRNHGESGGGLTGVGLTEWQDVAGAAAYLRTRPDQKGRAYGFVSFCMGANATIVALAKAQDALKDVRFLVAIQPVSAEVFVKSYLRAVYTPLSVFLAGIVDWFIQRRGGYPLAAMSPVQYARQIRIPTLVVQAPADRWTTRADTRRIFDAIAGEKEIWWLEGITRRFDSYNFVGEHPEKVLDFIHRH